MKCLFSKLAQVLQAITNFTNTLECSRLGLDALSQTVERSAELPTEKPFAQSLP
jgi:NifU-like protein involved in Fe-S cluster formation